MWTASWHSLAGRNGFLAKFDSLFTLKPHLADLGFPPDISGLVGMYAHGNEPSHHTVYLYSLLGRPWKTQELVKRILDSLYAPRPDGLCGNDDCGQMSAWFVMSALGFAPVNPCGGEYVIGAPHFESVSVNVGKRQDLRRRGEEPLAQESLCAIGAAQWEAPFRGPSFTIPMSSKEVNSHLS